MSNAMINVTVEANPVLARVQGAQDRVRNQAPAWRVIGVKVKQSVLKNFLVGGWYPEKWQKSRRAMLENGQTLVKRAVLRNSVMSRSGNDFAAAGPQNIVYAAIHNFGGACGRNHSVQMPARPYLPVKDGRLHPDDELYTTATLGNWIAKGEAKP